MIVRELYESLLEGNKLTLSFASHADYISVYSQLRNIKSVQDSAMQKVAGFTISEGKVIRTEKIPSIGTNKEPTHDYRIWLGERKVEHKIKFQILDIEPPSQELAEPSDDNKNS